VAKPEKVVFAQLYYPQALAAMRQRKMLVVPLHTTESPFDPLNAALDVVATDHHGLAILLDSTMAEASWATLTRRGSMLSVGRLSGYTPARDLPALAYVLADLRSAPTPGVEVLETGAKFGVSGSSRVFFQGTEEIGDPVSATTWPYKRMWDNSTEIFTEWTTQTLWAAPWTVGDALYLGHPSLMSDQIEYITAVYGSGTFGFVFEYYDDHTYTGPPDEVAISSDGSALEFEAVDYVFKGFTAGTYSATILNLRVRVTYKPTGVSEEVLGNSSDELVTGFLGQLSPSTTASDYELSAEWLPMVTTVATNPEANGGTVKFEFQLPDDTGIRRWAKTTIDDDSGFWMRQRLALVTWPLAADPEIAPATVVFPSSATLTGRVVAKQGTLTTGVNLGTSDGKAFQEFDVGSTDVVEGGVEAVYVTTPPSTTPVLWTRVENLYTAGASDLVFEEEEDPIQGIVRIRTGDGTYGAIPAQDATVSADVRRGAQSDGNVGALSIDRMVGGGTGLSNIRNPQAAYGWAPIEGGDPDDAVELERSRRRGPADYRAIGRALTPDDMRFLLTDPRAATGFTDADGGRPIKRAGIILEGSGPKTARVVLVGSSGGTLTTDQIDLVGVYLNGSTRFLQTYGGVEVANQQGDVVNYTQDLKSFTITATVLQSMIDSTEGQAAVKAAIMAALDKYVDPLAPPLVSASSDNWLWAIGQNMDDTLVKAAIASNIAGLVNLSLTTAPNLTISEYGLPDHDRDSTTITLVGI